MLLARCPLCHEPVRLPDGLLEDASDRSVRCPWCGDTYAVQRVVETLPPALVVVDEMPGAARSEPAEPLVVADEDASLFVADEELAGEASEVEGTTGKEESSSFDFFEPAVSAEGHSAGETHARPAAPGLRTKPVRRKKSSPVMLLVQWIGGGVAGLVIAGGILWYLDRLPAVGPLARWANRDGAPAGVGATPPAGSGQRRLTSPAADASGSKASTFELPDFSEENPGDLDPTEYVGRGAEEEESPQDSPSDAAEAGPDAGGAADEGAGAAGEADAAGAAPAAGAATSPELAASLAAADQALRQLTEYEGANRTELVRRTLKAYRHLAILGEQLATAPPGAEPAELEAILRPLMEREDLLSAFGKYAVNWLAQGPRRENRGLVAVGTLISEGGEIRLNWPGEQPLRLAGDRAEGLERLEGQQVLVLGQIAFETTPTVSLGTLWILDDDTTVQATASGR